MGTPTLSELRKEKMSATRDNMVNWSKVEKPIILSGDIVKKVDAALDMVKQILMKQENWTEEEFERNMENYIKETMNAPENR